MSDKVRAAIDRNVCVGSGTCEALDPSVFRVGDNGIAYLLDEGVDDAGLLQLAEASCPSGAIRLVSADS